MTSTGVVTTTTADPSLSNNIQSRNMLIAGQADAATFVSVPSSVSASVVVSGTVSFGNAGSASATGVGGTVTFSAGAQLREFPVGAFTTTVAGLPALVFPSTMPGLGSVNPSVTTTFTFTFRTPGLTGTYFVTSTVASTTPDANTSNNVSVASMSLATVPNNAVLTGLVFQDIRKNRIFDPGLDLPIANFRVEVIRVTGTTTTVFGSGTTGADGRYTISDLTPGTGYSIRFFDGSGNVIFGTPFNQQMMTLLGNPSTGTNSLTSAVTPGAATPLSTLIDDVTLYAGDNVQQQNLPLDPSGVIYDSVTRRPLAGATVKLVYEGSSSFNPSTQTLSGTDSVVTGINGLYQFFFINNPPPGVYRLDVTPPGGYLPPQAVQGGVASAQGVLNAAPGITLVQAQATPPAVGVNGATPVIGLIGGLGTQYFLRLQLNFPGFFEVINNNIPVDPLSDGALLVSKTGNKTVAELGDSVHYTIRIRNTTAIPIGGVTLNDLLPAGFRYILGTARLGGTAVANPAGGVGRELTFDVGTIAAQATADLTYFVRLGVGSQQGDGINRATVIKPVRSNTALFKVNVQGGVFSNEGCITGKVYVDCDGNAMQNNVGASRELGIPGVRLVMVDGTFIITDSEGKYSLCGVKSQTHVIKVDRTTLPKGSRLVPSSNRNAGVGDSIFVDLKGGELARADFIEGSCTPEVLDQVKVRRAQGGVTGPEVERRLPFIIENKRGEVPQQILTSPPPSISQPVPLFSPGGMR